MNFELRLSLLILLLFFNFSFSQERLDPEYGKLSPADISLQVYEKDSTAAAVVLYEYGHYHFEIVGDYIKLMKDVHRRIKIFDSKRFDFSMLDIPLAVSENGRERISGYKAMTHNGEMKTPVTFDAAFVTSRPGGGRVGKIVFPNVKDGSILEYAYRIESSLFFNFDGWEFQMGIPKLYSEFVSEIPGNFNYNQVIYGSLKPDIQKHQVEANCLTIMDGMLRASCSVSMYIMFDVPAFETENYMLSPANYISKVEYEPYSFIDYFGGKPQIFTREWNDVDKLYRKGDYIGNQLNKTGFFKRNLPDSILSISDDLERAKAVYTFIQNHYTWDETYYSSETQVKDAFNEKKGSVPEINISLINALDAAGLDVRLMLLSTRDSGLPTQEYPVMTKFNYTIAVLNIGNQTYLLDATDKLAPFGIIPFRALNVQGRVMDFKNESYWAPLEPYAKNIYYSNAQLTANGLGGFTGKVSTASYGYIGLEKRHEIESEELQGYIKTRENADTSKEIENLEIENVNEIDEPLKETYQISLEPETVGDKVVLYPFFDEPYISENPFKQETRRYPLDFGFPFTNTYIISIDLAGVYQVEELPKSRTVRLPGEDGNLTVTYASENDKINIRFNFNLKTYRYQPDAYQSLKELFETMVAVLKNEPVVLKKI